MVALIDLRPTIKKNVFDLVQKAGYNVSDWIASSSNPSAYKSNPKYCYNWSFVERGRVVILNLWWDVLEEEPDGTIVQRNNFRADGEAIRAAGGRTQWVQRAHAIDQALQIALNENIAVRVIINAGAMRNKGDPNGNASKVDFRELDTVPWTITEYDWSTGQHVITRGIFERRFVDQFSLDQAQKASPERFLTSGYVFVRDPNVRSAALQRANGHCEFCNTAGFKMPSGAVYLETHHIVPLCEGGPDRITNVAALCPNDHRMAHYGIDSALIRERLLEIVKDQSQPS